MCFLWLSRWFSDPVSADADSGGDSSLLYGAGHRSEDAFGQHRRVDGHQPVSGRTGSVTLHLQVVSCYKMIWYHHYMIVFTGIASVVTSMYLCLYYNVINAWSFWYLFHSFQVRLLKNIGCFQQKVHVSLMLNFSEQCLKTVFNVPILENGFKICISILLMVENIIKSVIIYVTRVHVCAVVNYHLIIASRM